MLRVDLLVFLCALRKQRLFKRCPNMRHQGRCITCKNYKKCARNIKKRALAQRNTDIDNTKLKIEIIVFVILIILILILVINWTIGKKEVKTGNEVETESETETQIETENEKETYPIISGYGPGEIYYYIFSETEKTYIAKLVYKEARGEKFEGKVAVAAVAINRLYSDDSLYDTSSIYSIITQNNQFAAIDDVTDEMLAEVPECMEAVEAACKGWDPTRKVFPGGAKFFYAPKGITAEEEKKREGIKKMQIGNHNFHNSF